jgi:hypothetical protein
MTRPNFDESRLFLKLKSRQRKQEGGAVANGDGALPNLNKPPQTFFSLRPNSTSSEQWGIELFLISLKNEKN